MLTQHSPDFKLFGSYHTKQIVNLGKVQRSPLFCANIVKKDPGRARQNSLATAGTNFTKSGAQNKGDLCTGPEKMAFTGLS